MAAPEPDRHDIVTERSPLLPSPQTTPAPARNSSSAPLQGPSGRFVGAFHPAFAVIPLIFAFHLASVLPTTTTIELVRRIVCRLWYSLNDPDKLPSGGNPPHELCDAAPVEQWFSFSMTIVMLIQNLGGLVAYAASSYFASRLGRKPVMIGVMTLAVLSMISFIFAVRTDGIVTLVFLTLWHVLGSIGHPLPALLVSTMYVVDLTTPLDRTFLLSVTNGAAHLGLVPSYVLGGTITRLSGNVLFVFYLSLVLNVLCLVYSLFLPESFGPEKREEARLQREAEAGDHGPYLSLFTRAKMALGRLVGPFTQLKPTQNPKTGKKNRRLVYCAAAIFLGDVGMSYFGMTFILFATAKFHFTPEDNGFSLSLSSILTAVYLTFILPIILRWGRPLYRQLSPSPVVHDAEPGSFNEVHSMEEESSHFDVHLTIASWLYGSAIVMLLGFAQTKAQLITAMGLVAFASGAKPAFSSVVVATVDPLRSAEVLSSMEIIGTLGKLISPVTIGMVASATIATVPQTVFIVQGVIVSIAALIMLFVRDSDRHVQ